MFTIAIRPVMPLIDYTVNYSYIAGTLCENRTKKEMDCKGKCYLSKELSKSAQDSAKQDPLKLSVFIELFTAAEVFKGGTAFNFDKDRQKQNTFLSISYSFSLLSRIFHPPLLKKRHCLLGTIYS